MFRNKKKASQHAPLTPAKPSSSAALAASSAFVKNANANASLSSAAAAAALRSHTPPPTNPGDLQTKRMNRRGSTSSYGSAPPSRSISPARPGLQRTNSGGSMTERSFRSPSPHRPGTANSTREADPDAPPVPPLPNPASPRATHQKRSSSVEPQNGRVQSPQPRAPGGRGISLDTAHRTPQRGPALPALDTSQASPATDSKRNSINFSRPMSPPLSPVGASPVGGQQGRSGWFTAPVGSNAEPRRTAHEQFKAPTGANAVNTYGVQQTVLAAANAPVKTKKKGQAASTSFKPTMVFDPNTRTMKPASEMYPPAPARDELRPEPEPEPARVSNNLAARTQQGVSPTTERSYAHHQRATSGLTKQPSVVRERREEEAEAEATSPRYSRVASPPPSSPRPMSAVAYSPPRQSHARTASLQREAVAKAREASLSPGRQAHFSAAPVIFSQDNVRHDPPPRSLSPAKPALKQSPASSVRTASPVANFAQSPGSRVPASDPSVSGSEDGNRPASRRKSVRVSFGDEPPQIIPEAASPTPAAPAKPVYSDENFEMSPRPVLPSFGSIRNRDRQSPAVVPERAVKVTETVPSTSTSAHGSTDSATAPGLESSSDLALGGILSQDLLARDAFLAAGSDQKEPHGLDPNAPLPPEVTSVEGTGYVSDQSDVDDDVAAGTPPVPTAPTVLAHPTKDDENTLAMSGATLVPDEAEKKLTAVGPGPVAATVQSVAEVPSITEVPAVSVQPPTPAAVEEAEPEDFQLKMPGGATDIWDEDGQQPVPSGPGDNPPAAEPSVTAPAVAQAPAVVASSPSNPATPVHTVVEESDDDSIYSDAEEDLSDHEEGFASLNAIVESPLASPTSSPLAARGALPSSPLARAPDSEPTAQDWDESKAYWSRLSEQRKLELEKQARPDAYAEEPTPTPAARSVKQKSAPSRTQNASAAGVAAGAGAAALTAASRPQQQQKQQQKPLRSSMRQSQPQPVAKPQAQREEIRMRTTMRGSSGQESTESDVRHFRQSMRSGAGPSHARVGSSGSTASSARVEPGLQQSRYAPTSSSEPRKQSQRQPVVATATTSQRPQPSRTASGSRVTAAAPASQPYKMPALTRRGSGDSDSSFKRARPSGSVMSDGGFSMRRTMRGSAEPPRAAAPAPAPTPAPAPASDRTPMARTMRRQSPTRPATASELSSGKARRFSLRSLSPSGSLLGGRRKMLASLQEQGSPVRPKHNRAQSAELRPQQPAPIPAPTMRARSSHAPASRFKSRYADDSDEDNSPVQRRFFKSRFADSDDEDEPQELTPVRGIPRKPGAEDGDSTDLEEESEVGELRPAAKANTTSPQGSSLAAGSMRSKPSGLAESKHAPPPQPPQVPTAASPVTTSRKEKRSFFSIRRPKRASSVPARGTPPIDHSQPLPTSTLATSSSPQSPASRPGSRPQSPKLQRRRTPQSMIITMSGASGAGGGDNWPLRSGEDPAGGAAASTPARPDVGKRRSTIDGVGAIAGGAAPGLRFDEANVESTGGGEPRHGGPHSARTGKKKKFPMLRKAFGLDD